MNEDKQYWAMFAAAAFSVVEFSAEGAAKEADRLLHQMKLRFPESQATKPSVDDFLDAAIMQDFEAGFGFNPNRGIDEEHEIMTVEEFLDAVRSNCYVDDDGYGHPATATMMDCNLKIQPSTCDIPHGATHIVWFNR